MPRHARVPMRRWTVLRPTLARLRLCLAQTVQRARPKAARALHARCTLVDDRASARGSRAQNPRPRAPRVRQATPRSARARLLHLRFTAAAPEAAALYLTSLQ